MLVGQEEQSDNSEAEAAERLKQSSIEEGAQVSAGTITSNKIEHLMIKPRLWSAKSIGAADQSSTEAFGGASRKSGENAVELDPRSR